MQCSHGIEYPTEDAAGKVGPRLFNKDGSNPACSACTVDSWKSPLGTYNRACQDLADAVDALKAELTAAIFAKPWRAALVAVLLIAAALLIGYLISMLINRSFA